MEKYFLLDKKGEKFIIANSNVKFFVDHLITSLFNIFKFTGRKIDDSLQEDQLFELTKLLHVISLISSRDDCRMIMQIDTKLATECVG